MNDMEVIPAINETDFREIINKVRKAEEFLPKDGWVHIDVADGVFTRNFTWSDPRELENLKTWLNIEVHLMVQEPEAAIAQWCEAVTIATKGKRRLLVHFEVMTDPSYILETCRRYGVDSGLSINPLTSAELVTVYARDFNLLQVLAVTPGVAGQTFQPSILEKIKYLREKAPYAIIEVDGGINPETAQHCKLAGANVAASSSYIFGNPSPKSAYEELVNI